MPILAVSLPTIAVAVHVAAVLVAFGALFTYPTLVAFVRRVDPRALGALHRAQHAIARRVIPPALAVVLASGLYLAGKEDVFSKGWVIIPLVLIVVLGALNGAILARGYARLAETAPTDQSIGAEYTALARRIDAAGLVAAGLVLLTIYVMVAKPFG